MPQFDVSTYSSQVFWLFLSITFLIFFLKTRLIPRIENILQERYFRIQDEQKKLDLLKNKIDILHKTRQQKIDDAHNAVKKMVIDTKKELALDKDAKMNDLEREIHANMIEFNNQLKWQKQEAKQQYEENFKEHLKTLQEKIVPPQ